MINVLLALAAALYAGTAAILIASLVGARRFVPPVGAAVTAAAVVAQTAALALYTAQTRELPLVGMAPALCTLAYLLGGFLLPATVFKDTRPLALVLAPLAAILLLVAMIVGVHPAGEPMAFRGWWLGLHIVLGFVGYVCLAVAFAAGLFYLLQLRELKEKRFGRLFRFIPPLAVLDRVGRIALQVGFPALTLNLALGWAWTVRFRNSLFIENPQVVWGILSWVVFVAALVAGTGGAGRGRRSALVSVFGFLVVVVAYLLWVGPTGGQLFHVGV